MARKTVRRIIVGASSDIGMALARDWRSRGLAVAGTYRTSSPEVQELIAEGVELVHLDLADRNAAACAKTQLLRYGGSWEVLVLAAGTQEPVGLFSECEFVKWAHSISVNFTAQMAILHVLLPFRDKRAEQGPIVLMFAGGGTNQATLNYSAYTVSKIALIKMCELLDAEIPDVRFAIVGPGWVNTKIHQATLGAGARAGANYRRTRDKLASDECVPMATVVDCCNWMVAAPRDVVSGRNLSLVYDCWGEPELNQLLKRDPNMYKLRRFGNERLVRNFS